MRKPNNTMKEKKESIKTRFPPFLFVRKECENTFGEPVFYTCFLILSFSLYFYFYILIYFVFPIPCLSISHFFLLSASVGYGKVRQELK